MTTLEAQIIAKFHSEILAAEATVRGPIIDSLYAFLNVIEKRIALTVSEAKADAPSAFRQIEAFGAGVVQKVENIV